MGHDSGQMMRLPRDICMHRELSYCYTVGVRDHIIIAASTIVMHNFCQMTDVQKAWSLDDC